MLLSQGGEATPEETAAYETANEGGVAVSEGSEAESEVGEPNQGQGGTDRGGAVLGDGALVGVSWQPIQLLNSPGM